MKAIKVEKSEDGTWRVGYRGVVGYVLYWAILSAIAIPIAIWIQPLLVYLTS